MEFSARFPALNRTSNLRSSFVVSPQEPGASAPGKSRLVYLDGLRGLAVLMIVVYHIWHDAGLVSWWVRVGPVHLNLAYPIEALGGSRVSLFFVLSGFLLYLPFARAQSGKASPQSRAKWENMAMTAWLWRRFRRLCPPYWAAIAFSLVQVAGMVVLSQAWRFLRGLPPHPVLLGNLPTALPASLVFMHGMVPGSEWPMFNVPLWTMTPEVQLYLTFPLLLGIARKRSLQAAVGLAVAVSILARLWLFAHRGIMLALPGGPSVSLYAYGVNTFVGRWAEFALGMGAAGVVAAGKLPSSRLLVSACVGALTLFFTLRACDGRVLALVPWVDVLGGGAYALLVLACATTPRLARCFSWRPLTMLGVLSFSLYLTHWPTLNVLSSLSRGVFHCEDSPLRIALKVCLGFPLMLGVARLFWQVCERPFLSADAQVLLPGVFSHRPDTSNHSALSDCKIHTASPVRTVVRSRLVRQRQALRQAASGVEARAEVWSHRLVSPASPDGGVRRRTAPPPAYPSSTPSALWLRVGGAVGLVALAAFVLRHARAPLPTLLPGYALAVLLAARFSPPQGAMFASGLAAFMVAYNLPPEHTLAIASPYRCSYGLFLAACGMISLYRPICASLAGTHSIKWRLR